MYTKYKLCGSSSYEDFNPPQISLSSSAEVSNWRPAGSGETDGGAGGCLPSLAGHFEVFGPPVTTFLVSLSDL